MKHGPEIRVRWQASFHLIGSVLLYLTIPLAFPIVFAVAYGESIRPFVVAILITLALGAAFRHSADPEMDLGPREAFLAVALIWFLIALIGAIPFVVAGVGTVAHPINAMFESMSGLTTTGGTVLRDFSIHGRSILMWRQLIQWLGGLGILILATAVLSSLGVGGAQLMETETQTQNVNRLSSRISETARLILGLYLGITVLAVLSFWGIGLARLDPRMDLYHAIAHAFTAVATAGFSPQPLSAGAFTPIVQWTMIPFMVVGSTSFVLLYVAITDDPMRLPRNEEFRFYLGTITFFSALVAILLFVDPTTTFGYGETTRHAIFTVTSIITTTGYASTDYTLWNPAAKHLLFLCMFLGGMAGSTTCSIKAVRWLVTIKSLHRTLFTSIHPEAIRPVRLSGTAVNEETIRDIYAYLLLSIFLFTLLTIFIVVDAARVEVPVNEFEAMGAAASMFLNIGPAFGAAGPYGTYDGFPVTTKVVMIGLMWIGRIEIIPVLVLLTKSFWTS